MGGEPGFPSRRYSEVEIKHQQPKAAFVCSNYWGVLKAVWEPKTSNYSQAGQLFSA